jgi:hypothetical protein
MGEQHLDFLPTTTGLHVCRSRSERTGHVAGIFVQIPRDLAGDSVRAALRFEFADVAIQFADAIDPCRLGRDAAPGGSRRYAGIEPVPCPRAGVTVTLGVEYEIGPGECALGSL